MEITSFTPIEDGGGRIPMPTDTRTYTGYIRKEDQAKGTVTYQHPSLGDSVIAAHLILFTYKITKNKITAVKFSYFPPGSQRMLITNPTALPNPYPYDWQK